MNLKASKLKRALAAIAIVVVLVGLIAFGFHFSCRLKAQGDSRVTYSFNRTIQTVNYLRA